MIYDYKHMTINSPHNDSEIFATASLITTSQVNNTNFSSNSQSLTTTSTSTSNNLTPGIANNSSEFESTSARRNLNISFESEINTQYVTNTIRINRVINSNESIIVEWDYKNPCLHCGCLYLKNEKN